MHEIAFKSLTSLATLTSGLGKQKRLLILIYHRVLDKPDFMRPGEVDKSTFDWQMQLLSKYFNVLSLADGLNGMQNDSLPARAICITFDDGYADNCINALPILQKYSLHATFFVASGYLDGGRMWNDSIIEAIRYTEQPQLNLQAIELETFDISSAYQKALSAKQILLKLKHLAPQKRQTATDYIASHTQHLPNNLMLTTKQLQQLHHNGMEIGGHTTTHPIMATLTDNCLTEELMHNKRTLDQLLQSNVRYFAYPNGKPQFDYLPEQIALVQQCGYQAALSTVWGVADKNTDRWQLPRFTPWDDTPEKFMFRVARIYTQCK